MATFVQDTFTDTNGTILSDHTGETGASWTRISANETTIQSNQLQAPAATVTCEFYASGVPTTAEYDVAIDVISNAPDALTSIGLLGRVETVSQFDYYLADYLGSSTSGSRTWRMFKRVNGSFTSLGTYAEDWTGTKTAKLEILDATKKLYVDDVERISSADNAITDAGRPGLRHATGSTTFAGKINGDNFLATEAGGGGATGNITQTLPSISQSAFGEIPSQGSSAQSLPSISQAVVAEVPSQGVVAQTLPGLNQSAAGSIPSQGTAAQTFPSITQSASSESPPSTGEIAQALPGVSQDATGKVLAQGSISQVLPSIRQAASGKVFIAGSIVQALPSVRQSLSGGDEVPFVRTPPTLRISNSRDHELKFSEGRDAKLRISVGKNPQLTISTPPG